MAHKCTSCYKMLEEDEVRWSDDSVYTRLGRGIFLCTECYLILNREAKYEDYPDKFMKCSECGGWFSREGKPWASVCSKCYRESKKTKIEENKNTLAAW